MKSFRYFVTVSVALLLWANSALSEVWDFAPGSGDWNTAVNWTPDTVPNGPAATATFAASTVTAISLSADTEVNVISFNAGASFYTITASPTFSLTLSGIGISNLSGNTQNFVVTAGPFAGFLGFNNNATAGSNTNFTVNGAAGGFNGGQIGFTDSSNAGSGTFTNQGGSASGGTGGSTRFFGTATAASGTFTNNAATDANATAGATIFFVSSNAGSGIFTNNGSAGVSIPSGLTAFFDDSTAANGTFLNNAATGGGFGGGTRFDDMSDAGTALITNFGATVAGDNPGGVSFNATATASSATIINNGGLGAGASGGATQFSGGSNAGSANITNQGGVVSGAFGGFISLTSTSSTANATITNNGGAVGGALGGRITFEDGTTAGSANITNNGGVGAGSGGGTTTFVEDSNAGSATFTNNSGTPGSGAGRVDFFGDSRAGTASFVNNGNALPGTISTVTDFHNDSSADQATIVSHGGTGVGAAGGQVDFMDSSKAGSATLTANAGTVAGASGAFTVFFNTSAANSATLIANGGLGQGGGIYFFNQSTGDTSRVEVFGNGFLDISGHDAPGVTIGSIEGSGNAFLGANNLTVGSNNLSTTFSGTMQDGAEDGSGGTGGSFTKIGTGTLIFSGFGSYTGATMINAGVLQLDGTIISSTDVNPGGTLSGTGIVGASMTNNGIVSPGSPGNSPGTLHVSGSYFQTGTATLRIDIGGLAPNQHDLLDVDSPAGLGGTLQLVQFNNFMPMNGDEVIILTAGGSGVGGQFSTVTDNFPGLIQPHVFYDAFDVRVVFSLANSFASQAVTPNQEAVADNLDDAANDPAAAQLIGFLGGVPMGNLPHAYDLIAPEELAAIYEVGFSQSMVQNNNLERRMDDIRAGSNGFCANNFVATTSGKEDVSKGADGKVVLPANVGPEVYIPTENNRWGVFVNGTGNFVNVGDDDFNAPGYEITSGNFTLGADYRVSEHFAVGINGGYANSQADLVNDGRVDVDGGKIGAYATVFGQGFFGGKIYIDGAIGGGLNCYDTLRIGLQDELVRGDTDGSEFNGMISYGSDWTFGCFNIGTWSTIQYTRVNIDEFTELGSLAPLEIQDQAEDSLRSTTGIRASYDIKAGRALIRPELRVAWQHEHGDRGYQVDSRFASGAGGIFRVHGPEVGKDAALIGTGLSMQWNNRFATYVYYDGVLGRANYDNSAVTGGLRVGF